MTNKFFDSAVHVHEYVLEKHLVVDYIHVSTCKFVSSLICVASSSLVYVPLSFAVKVHAGNMTRIL